MVEWLIVLALIFLGVFFLVLELIVIPGTTIVGIFGALLVGLGVYKGFQYFDESIGYLILGGTFITLGGMLYYAFTSGVWDKFALKSTIDSKVNQGRNNVLKVGQQGISISTLKPVGKAEFDMEIYEVTSLGEYLEVGIEIQIVKIENNKILVEPINN